MIRPSERPDTTASPRPSSAPRHEPDDLWLADFPNDLAAFSLSSDEVRHAHSEILLDSAEDAEEVRPPRHDDCGF